jgi:hypothetical protein
MNANTYSPECFHSMHYSCDWDSCACKCHLRDLIDREADTSDEDLEVIGVQ